MIAFIAVTVFEVIPVTVNGNPALVVAAGTVIILGTENSLCPDAAL